jgi:hypothetical protein
MSKEPCSLHPNGFAGKRVWIRLRSGKWPLGGRFWRWIGRDRDEIRSSLLFEPLIGRLICWWRISVRDAYQPKSAAFPRVASVSFFSPFPPKAYMEQGPAKERPRKVVFAGSYCGFFSTRPFLYWMRFKQKTLRKNTNLRFHKF